MIEDVIKKISPEKIIDTLHLVANLGSLTFGLHYVLNKEYRDDNSLVEIKFFTSNVDAALDCVFSKYYQMGIPNGDFDSEKAKLRHVCNDIKNVSDDLWESVVKILMLVHEIRLHWLILRKSEEIKLILISSAIILQSIPTLKDNLGLSNQYDIPTDDVVEQFMKQKIRFLYESVPTKTRMLDQIAASCAYQVTSAWETPIERYEFIPAPE